MQVGQRRVRAVACTSSLGSSRAPLPERSNAAPQTLHKPVQLSQIPTHTHTQDSHHHHHSTQQRQRSTGESGQRRGHLSG